MSRLGNTPVPIPSGVQPTLAGRTFTATGPKGTLSLEIPSGITVELQENRIVLARPGDEPRHRAFHGLARSLVANAVTGVHTGFEKRMSIHGVGYNAKLEGGKLVMNLGFNAPVVMEIPEGLDIEVPNTTSIAVRGVDKQAVGQFAAEVRAKRPPEPYKQKGIRYFDEVIVKKAGKSFVSGA